MRSRRSRRQWRAHPIDWVILTDQRLLLVGKGVPVCTLELDPSKVKEWIAAESDVQDSRPVAEPEPPKKGLWRMLTHAASSGHGTRPPPLFVLRDA